MNNNESNNEVKENLEQQDINPKEKETKGNHSTYPKITANKFKENTGFKDKFDDFKSEFSPTGIIILVVLTLGLIGFAGYSFFNKNSEENILITDRVATTVVVDLLHNDEKHSVDLTNKYSGEKEINFSISINCPAYNDIQVGTAINVIKTSKLDPIKNKSWNEYSGLYEKVCTGKDIQIKELEEAPEEPK